MDDALYECLYGKLYKVLYGKQFWSDELGVGSKTRRRLEITERIGLLASVSRVLQAMNEEIYKEKKSTIDYILNMHPQVKDNDGETDLVSDEASSPTDSTLDSSEVIAENKSHADHYKEIENICRRYGNQSICSYYVLKYLDEANLV